MLIFLTILLIYAIVFLFLYIIGWLDKKGKRRRNIIYCFVMHLIFGFSTIFIMLVGSSFEAGSYMEKNKTCTIGLGYGIFLIGFSSLNSLLTIILLLLIPKKSFVHSDYSNTKNEDTSLINLSTSDHITINLEEINKDEIIQFIKYEWDQKNIEFTETIYYYNSSDWNLLINEDNLKLIYEKFINDIHNKDNLLLYTLKQSEDAHFYELQKTHSKECNCWTLNQNNCSWSKHEILIDGKKLNLHSDWFINSNFLHLSIMNKMNIHFLTKFNCPENININFIDFLQRRYDFNCIFNEIYRYMVESIIIREDGLNLILQLIDNLNDKFHKQIILDHVIKNIFQIWPPPLWYFSLLKCRILKKSGILQFNQAYKGIKDYEYFINDPFSFELFELCSVLNLTYKTYWKHKYLCYGIFLPLDK